MAAALVAALTCSATARAANLVVNPDFTADITTAWTSSGTGGAAVWNSGLGSPTPGSADLVAVYAGVYVTRSLTQCVAIAAPGNFDYLTRTYTGSNVGNAVFHSQVTFFGGGSCGGSNLGTSVAAAAVNIDGSWWEYSLTNAPLPATTVSALVELFVDSGTTESSSSNILFDNVRFGPAGTVPVELQSFSAE
jgi:hypothetical protein